MGAPSESLVVQVTSPRTVNKENQDTPAAIRELATEMRRFRQAILLGFAIFAFIGGLLLLCYPSYEVPLWAFFAATAVFLFLAAYSRIARVASGLREEAKRQHSSPSRLSGER